MEIRSRVDAREPMVRNGGVREMWRPTRNTVSATCTGAAPVQESLWKLKTPLKISRNLAPIKPMFLAVLLFPLNSLLLQGMIIIIVIIISPFCFSMPRMIRAFLLLHPLLTKGLTGLIELDFVCVCVCWSILES